MGAEPDTKAVSARATLRAILAGAALCAALSGQIRTLDEAGARRPPDYVPAHEGESCTVVGTVAVPALRFLEYTLLGIQDEKFGLVLEVPKADRSLDGFRPGDRLEVSGTIGARAGQVVVFPKKIRLLAKVAPPAVQRVPVAELNGFRYLGRYVETDGAILEIGDTTGGAYMLLGDKQRPFKVFLPHDGRSSAGFSGLDEGDKVRVKGLSLQYCPRPPHNRWFEVVLSDPQHTVLLSRRWSIVPGIVLCVLVVVAAVCYVWWRREQRMREQREVLRRTYELGEEVLGASSVESILKRVSEVLPEIFGISQVRLYTYNRAARTLDCVPGGAGDEPGPIVLSSPPGGTQAGVAACFHYRTLLAIPDSARSPFPVAPESGAGGPKAMLIVPMFAQGEVVGVFEMDQNDHTCEFSADEQALAQHLGNQIGAAIRLLDQRQVQEQLSRTEKVAAVGRLISGVVNDLRTPLASISEYAELALSKGGVGAAEREIRAIAAEAHKAAGMVSRLVSFAGTEQAETRPVEINGLLRSLMEFREGEWKARGIRVRDLISRERLEVLGSQGQLEEVFLNLLVHAEQSLADRDEKFMVVRTGLLGKRLLIEISFSGPRGGVDPLQGSGESPGLSVCRSVIAGHGGEIRLVQAKEADPRFEIELPCAPRERAAQAAPAPAGGPVRSISRRATALIIENDEQSQRHLLTLMAARGYRVVPVGNADVGLDLAQRMRFDLAFCSVRAPGLNWVELSERLQSRVDAFVLMADGYDAELSADFEGDGRFVLPRPIQEQELDRILNSVEPVSTRGAAGA